MHINQFSWSWWLSLGRKHDMSAQYENLYLSECLCNPMSKWLINNLSFRKILPMSQVSVASNLVVVGLFPFLTFILLFLVLLPFIMEDNFFGNFIYEGNLDHSYYVRLRQETNESKNSWREKEFIMYIINYILRNEWLLSSRFKYNKEYSSICLLFYFSYYFIHKSKWQIPFCLLLFNIMMDVVLMWWLFE